MDYYIYENGQLINTIVADEAFVSAYCAEHGYTYEAVSPEPEPTPEPTQLDRVEAQATYTALITDTLLPEVTA